MQVSAPFKTVSPVELLQDAVVAFAAEKEIAWRPASLGEQLVAMRRCIDRLEAEFSRRLARFDSSGAAGEAGAVNTTAWLRGECRLSAPAAAERVEVARQLPKLIETNAAFRKGDIAYQHAAVIARTASELGIDAVKRAEAGLLEAAESTDPGRFRVIAQSLRYVLDPEAALDAANALHARRFLHVSQAPHGGFAVDGLLDPEGGALLRTALDAVNGPPAPSDDRTPAQRRADALVELASAQLRMGNAYAHGRRPHLIVTAPAAAANGGDGARPGEIHGAGPVPIETVDRLACDASVTLMSAPRANLWTSAARRVAQMELCVRRSSCETNDVAFRTAIGRRSGATSTMSSPGNAAVPRAFATSSCYADAITG